MDNGVARPADLGRSDVCIIGGGPAGIAVALRVAERTGLRVCLVESGGDRFDVETQDLARAECDGLDYYPFHETRVRALGGSTWSWGGVCTAFDPMAFESRPWLGIAGWPFPRSTVEAYLDDALRLCGISGDDQAEVVATSQATFDEAGLDAARVAPFPVYFSRPVRFGPAYGARMDGLPNLIVRRHSTVTRLVVEDDAIRAVEGSGPGGRPFRRRGLGLRAGRWRDRERPLADGRRSGRAGRRPLLHGASARRQPIPRAPRQDPTGSLGRGGAAGTLRFFRLSVADRLQRSERLLNYHANLQFGYVGQRSREWPAVRRLAIVTRSPWNESPYFQDAGGGRLGFRFRDRARPRGGLITP